MKLKLDLHGIYNRGGEIDRALRAVIDAEQRGGSRHEVGGQRDRSVGAIRPASLFGTGLGLEPAAAGRHRLVDCWPDTRVTS